MYHKIKRSQAEKVGTAPETNGAAASSTAAIESWERDMFLLQRSVLPKIIALAFGGFFCRNHKGGAAFIMRLDLEHFQEA